MTTAFTCPPRTSVSAQMGSKQWDRQAPSETAAHGTAFLASPSLGSRPLCRAAGSRPPAPALPPAQSAREALHRGCSLRGLCSATTDTGTHIHPCTRAHTPPHTHTHAHTHTHTHTAGRLGAGARSPRAPDPAPGVCAHPSLPAGASPLCPALEAVQAAAAAARTAARTAAARGQCGYGAAGSGQRPAPGPARQSCRCRCLQHPAAASAASAASTVLSPGRLPRGKATSPQQNLGPRRSGGSLRSCRPPSPAATLPLQRLPAPTGSQRAGAVGTLFQAAVQLDVSQLVYNRQGAGWLCPTASGARSRTWAGSRDPATPPEAEGYSCHFRLIVLITNHLGARGEAVPVSRSKGGVGKGRGATVVQNSGCWRH